MLSSPWKQLTTPQADRPYLALLSYLPLKSLSRLPAFIKYSLAIQGQLAAAPGIIGYSLNLNPFRLQFWTLSVWADEAALVRFVRAAPHAAVMKALQNHMGATAFVRWQLRGDGVPPSWSDAFARQRTQGSELGGSS